MGGELVIMVNCRDLSENLKKQSRDQSNEKWKTKEKVYGWQRSFLESEPRSSLSPLNPSTQNCCFCPIASSFFFFFLKRHFYTLEREDSRLVPTFVSSFTTVNVGYSNGLMGVCKMSKITPVHYV